MSAGSMVAESTGSGAKCLYLNQLGNPGMLLNISLGLSVLLWKMGLRAIPPHRAFVRVKQNTVSKTVPGR